MSAILEQRQAALPELSPRLTEMKRRIRAGEHHRYRSRGHGGHPGRMRARGSRLDPAGGPVDPAHVRGPDRGDRAGRAHRVHPHGRTNSASVPSGANGRSSWPGARSTSSGRSATSAPTGAWSWARACSPGARRPRPPGPGWPATGRPRPSSTPRWRPSTRCWNWPRRYAAAARALGRDDLAERAAAGAGPSRRQLPRSAPGPAPLPCRSLAERALPLRAGPARPVSLAVPGGGPGRGPPGAGGSPGTAGGVLHQPEQGQRPLPGRPAGRQRPVADAGRRCAGTAATG